MNRLAIIKLLAAPVATVAGLIGCLSQPALAQAVNGAAGFAASTSSLNSGFFSQGAAITSVSPDANFAKLNYGAWVRAGAGALVTNVQGSLTTTATPAFGGLSFTNPLKQRTSTYYSGIQAGVDLARIDIGNSGFNLVYGVSGGELSVSADPGDAAGQLNIKNTLSIPFVGAYATISKGGFVFESAYRHDFYTSSIAESANYPTFSGVTNVGPLEGGANTVSFSGSYRYNLPLQAFQAFVEPSAAIFISRISGSSAVQPNGHGLPPSTFSTNAFDSDLGRLGARFGFDLSVAGINLEPFAAASVFREFAQASTTGALYNSASPINETFAIGRIGTYGQYSIGATAVAAGNLIVFVRGDLRAGENLYGRSITGGMRYTF